MKYFQLLNGIFEVILSVTSASGNDLMIDYKEQNNDENI